MYSRLPIVRPKPGERVPPIKTQARSATILPNFVNLKFQIHNGKNYVDVTITEDMVGHKLGEFAPYVITVKRIPRILNRRESTLIVSLGRARTSPTNRRRTSDRGSILH